MKIRAATPDDVPFLIELDRSSATAAHWTEEQYRNIFRDCGDVSARLVLLAEREDGVLLGFLVAQPLAGDWELENIVVRSAERRKGIGSCLLDGLIDPSGPSASGAVFLEVRESNLAARRFYQKKGFQQAGIRKSYYRDPEEDAVLYRLDPRKVVRT